MEAKLYNIKGKEKGTVQVPETLFGVPWNADLVHQVVVSMQANARHSTAHTKDRGEVRGGGKKPWAQKGTGRARHGSSRSPIWAHGGVAHGPRNEKLYSKKINRKVREKALLTALSRKFADGEVIFIDEFNVQTPKASIAKSTLSALAQAGFTHITAKKNNAALVIIPRADRTVIKSFSNFGNINTEEVRNLNVVDVLESKYLVILEPEAAFEVLTRKRVVTKRTHADKVAKVAKEKVVKVVEEKPKRKIASVKVAKPKTKTAKTK